MSSPETLPARDDVSVLQRLKRRQAAERRFRLYGQAAIILAIGFLLVLLSSIVMKASSAFTRHYLVFDVPISMEIGADTGSAVTVAELNGLVRDELIASFPEAAAERSTRTELFDLTTRLAVLPLARRIAGEDDLVGQTVTARIPISDDIDLYLKQLGTSETRLELGPARLEGAEDGSYRLQLLNAPALTELSALASDTANPEGDTLINVGGTWFKLANISSDGLTLTYLSGASSDRSAAGSAAATALILKQPEANRQVTNRQIAWANHLLAQGSVQRRLNLDLFTHADSTYPELAGAAAAIVGSLFTMLVTALFALPIGILAAIYLEEFASRNVLTNLIEVNINNLAAVPSIIFGLLGASVLLNVLGMPRSIPLVGGLVLGLLILPTIIIASRAALKSVPSSIRMAALGMGASRSQAVFHHVLPLAAPGILTGAIIAMARALGETAPLLLIGMVAFISEIPSTPTEEATALPVLIFKWFSGAERAWEPMTSAIILILLAVLVAMNLVATLLRRRFEKKGL